MKRALLTIIICAFGFAMVGQSQTKLTHSATETIDADKEYLCLYKYTSTWSGLTYVYYQFNQAYQRVFDLGSMGLADDVDAIRLEAGCHHTKSTAGTQDVKANVYTLSGPFLYSNMTKIASGTKTIPNASNFMVDIPFDQGAPPIPGGSLIVAEFEIPQGSFYDSVRYFMGFNDDGQTDKTYYSAQAWSSFYGCYYRDPIDFATLGSPYNTWHAVLNLYINQKPENVDVGVTTNRDVDYTFDPDDFHPSFTDADGDSFKFIRIESLPDFGWIKLGSTFLLPGDTVQIADVPNLTYAPTRAFYGTDEFQYLASDGIAWAKDTAKVVITVLNTAPGTGIEDQIFASQISLFPNPSQGNITLEMDGYSNADVNFEVVDLMGRAVEGFTRPASSHHSLDLNHLPAGIYKLTIEQEGLRAVKNLVIQ